MLSCALLPRWARIPLLVAVASLACTNPPPLDPAAAVLPWSHELQNAEPYQPPFLARFAKGDRTLSVVAAYHGCDPRTFRLIDEVLATHSVRLAVIEGIPAALGTNPSELTAHLKEWSASGFCNGGGGSGYTAFHALEHGASVQGGEPDEPAVVREALREGFTVEDVLGFYFVRQIPQFQREGALEAKGLEACFRLLMDGVGKKAALEAASARFTLDDFRGWYQKRQGKTFDLATVGREDTAPLASGDFLQRLSSVTGRVRDRFVVQLIAARLATEKNVLIVYGGSHFATERPAFELLLGKPVEMRAGLGSAP